MLAKKNRLKKKKDFEKIFKEGKSFKEKFLIIKFLSNNLGYSRFGFIVSQKISKKAVLRNKIKRRMTEAVRGEIKGFKKGIDAIFIALPGIENQKFLEIKEIISNFFKKINL